MQEVNAMDILPVILQDALRTWLMSDAAQPSDIMLHNYREELL